MEMIYTIESLAQLLDCSEHTIYKLTSKKLISYFTIGTGKGIRFTQQQVDDYINSRTRKSNREIEREAIAQCYTRGKNGILHTQR